MNHNQVKFLINEFLTWSIFGALGRLKTYSDIATDKEKNSFRDSLKKRLAEVAREYTSPVTETKHLSNISNLADEMTSNFSGCLRNKRFRIGIAQKALNLYLKYLWCFSIIPLPPHCPFDSKVLGHLPECADLDWTSIDIISDYMRLVTAARRQANGRPLSEWELEIWNST